MSDLERVIHPTLSAEQKSTSFRVDFGSNAILQIILDRLRDTSPHWHQLIPAMANLRHRKFGSFAEAHLHLILTQAAAEFGTEINLNPIPDEATTQNFKFEKSQLGQISVKDLQTMRHVIEYDAVTKIEGLPTLWQIKINNSLNAKKTHRTSVKQLLSLEDIERQFTPLLEYYPGRERFGYVIVTNPESDRTDSLLQENFIRAGGKFVSLPITYDEFLADAKSASLLAGKRPLRKR